MLSITRRGRWMRAVIGVAVAATVFLSACGVSQVIDGARRATATEGEIQAQGRELHQQMVKKKLIYDDERINAYVSRVGNRVAAAAQSPQGGANKQLIFRFYVLDDPDTNAFAVPGGYVYVTRGLLALLNSEDELAAVMAHEIAHVADGHALKANQAAGRAGLMGGLGTMGLSVLGVVTFNPVLIGLATVGDTATSIGTAIYEQGYSRDVELVADRLGKGYASIAGYDPQAGARVLASFEQEAQFAQTQAVARGIKPQPVWGMVADHPSNAVRIQALAAVPAASARRAPESDYLQSIDGLVFGISDRIGVHRGTTFYSRTHGLSLAVPTGWFVVQSPDEQSVMFFNEKNTARIVLVSQDLATREDATGFATDFFGNSTLRGTARSIAGQAVWRGTAQAKALLYSANTYQVLTWTQSDRGFALIGARDNNSPLQESSWMSAYERTAVSLRPLRPDEVALAQSIKVRVESPRGKTALSYAALAQNAPLGQEAESVLRVLNGQYGNKQPPTAGTRLKVLR